MQLREWQERFQYRIFHPGKDDGNLFENLAPGSASRKVQLEIYSNAYAQRLVEALQGNYPALHQLLGDDEFDVMGRAYLGQYPSTQSSIRWFGNSLTLFLKQQTPYTDQPVFSELAEFEWALRHTLDAADANVLTVETLQSIAPEQWGGLHFTLHPSVSVMALQWNTPQIWQAVTTNRAPPRPEQREMGCIIYRRPDLVSAWRSMPSLELPALNSMGAGGSFADICEVVEILVDDENESALRSAELLRSWVEQGLISIVP